MPLLENMFVKNNFTGTNLEGSLPNILDNIQEVVDEGVFKALYINNNTQTYLYSLRKDHEDIKDIAINALNRTGGISDLSFLSHSTTTSSS